MEYVSAQADSGEIGQQLVELLRVETDLAYRDCRRCAVNVVDFLLAQSNRLSDVASALQFDHIDVDGCVDAQRMRRTLTALTESKQDVQQRSWNLFEDTTFIVENLHLVASLARLADKRVSLHVLSEQNYSAVLDLVEFYEMEVRLVVKLAFIETFTALTLLDATIVNILAETSLPVQLAKDVVSTDEAKGSGLPYESLKLLGNVLSTGCSLPYAHYEVLNGDFVSHCIGLIDADEEEAEPTSEAALRCLLAFNLHFSDDSGNSVVDTLVAAERCKALVERVLVLINRDVDPVWLYDDERKSAAHASSVLKFVIDLYSRGAAAVDRIIYSNDAEVLFDVVLRRIADMSPGTKLRTEYLSLALMMAKIGCLQATQQAELVQLATDLKRAEDCPDNDRIMADDMLVSLNSSVCL